MAKTWADIQNETLQLMHIYSINGVVQTATDDTVDYRASMVNAANTALRELADGRISPIKRRLYLAQEYVENMLGENESQFYVVKSRGVDITYSAINPLAYYFEINGIGTAYIEELDDEGDATVLSTIANTTSGTYTAYRGLISATEDATVQIRFAAGRAYSFRNVAMYAYTFDAAADVPAFTRYEKYSMRTLTEGIDGGAFMALEPNGLTLVDGIYRQTNSFRWEGDDTLVLDRYDEGQYEIPYYAYPTEITDSTSTLFVPELCSEAIDLLPLYMAAMLYSDDNPPLSSRYLEQYYAGKNALASRDQTRGKEEFVSESGWV